MVEVYSRQEPVRRSRRIEEAGPFLKWAGGKGRLLNQYALLFPQRFRRYHEPFLGGGAVFFHLQPTAADLSDSNPELINCYEVVRDDVRDLIRALRRYRYDKEVYYRTRAKNPERLDEIERAARTIFLNRTCFNGLYRLNRNGDFNVPMGSYANPTICQCDRLTAASRALRGTKLRPQSFEAVLDRTTSGDFVYFDPPYHPVSSTSNFTAYDKLGFDESDQRRLADVMTELDRRGVMVMQSNSNSPFIRKLYERFNAREVYASRNINCNSKKRGAIKELVITNY